MVKTPVSALQLQYTHRYMLGYANPIPLDPITGFPITKIVIVLIYQEIIDLNDNQLTL